jgi:hypothetical protein
MTEQVGQMARKQGKGRRGEGIKRGEGLILSCVHRKKKAFVE